MNDLTANDLTKDLTANDLTKDPTLNDLMNDPTANDPMNDLTANDPTNYPTLNANAEEIITLNTLHSQIRKNHYFKCKYCLYCHFKYILWPNWTKIITLNTNAK